MTSVHRPTGRTDPPGRPPGRHARATGVLAALLLATALALPPGARAAEGTAGEGAPAGKIREIAVSKTPYYTNIEAVIEGKLENYNSFKLNDPFRIVVDLWGVAQGTAESEIPANTTQVKAVKVSQQGDKLRLVVETPGDRPLPFLVSAEGNRLVLSVGNGSGEKVGSTDRPEMAQSKHGILGVDLEDLPDVSNVVITTSKGVSHEVTEGAQRVTLTFPGATAEANLLRPMDARRFGIPVRQVSGAKGKKGTEIAIDFEPGSPYTVSTRDDGVVVSFPKTARAAGATPVATLSPLPSPGSRAPLASPRETAEAVSRWGFLTHEGVTRKSYTGQRISLDFKDADLTNVFRIIAEVSNLNIITTDDVRGTVSVRLVNVPWDQALDIILQAKGLGAKLEGNVLRIAPLGTLRTEEKARLDAMKEVEKLQATLEGVTETIPVNYAKASELQGKVKDLLSEGGKVQIDDRTNTIIIRDLPRNVAEARALVETLDTAIPQVLIEARIVEVDTTFTRELGVQWGGAYRSGTSTQFGVSGIQDSSGSFLSDGALSNATPFSSPGGTPPNYAVNLPASVGLGSGGGVAFGILRDNLRLDLSLSALEASGKGKVISSPKVVTIDNREATIEQGTQIPYSTVSASGTQTQFVDATLSLKVTPHITPDGSVMMKLLAKNDSQGETGATGQPAINKKMATTEVLIRDGETAVIGGILQVQRRENLSGVPWFHKIPVLGWLFKKEQTQTSNRELLIFITPRILKEEASQAKTS